MIQSHEQPRSPRLLSCFRFPERADSLELQGYVWYEILRTKTLFPLNSLAVWVISRDGSKSAMAGDKTPPKNSSVFQGTPKAQFALNLRYSS